MVYLFVLAIVLLYTNTNYIINNRISTQSSLLTIQLSSSSSRHSSINLSGLTLEQKYRNCLDDLQTLKESLAATIEEYNICNADEGELESSYNKKSNVCKLLEEDYRKYCKSHNFKPPALDKDSCRTLLERIKECLEQKRKLGENLNKKIRECRELKKKIDERTEMYDKVDKRCSKIEQQLFNERSYTRIHVVEQEDVMDKPTSRLSSADASLLLEIVKQTEIKFQLCIEQLAELSERLADKTNQMYETSEQITTALGGAISKKVVLGKKKSKSTEIRSLENTLELLKEQKMGALKLQLSKENECRNLQTKLSQALERLQIAESQSTTSESRTGSRGCFGRFTSFVSRTCRRFTSRLTSRFTNRFTRNSNRRRRRESRF
ncbi:unnamed protein product [Cryptosporidium hominis]|uniref:Uncharacterized protein n=1 Tax=Cryptosporidium hominis TaxID=237895 RepID=A0A0S4TCQ4_CRYHO|nr:hypothetical protein [Cryptosporidium hominis TU502]OLQ16408.1 hypothetical protein ChTU502y2012_378g0125 [Cryptosporidium hominis]PPA62317.1 hypothetical protein ChUKH1_13445 [Cryptosporidium hominis]PPS93242.1 Uncharacterized protein GY17_00003779 [Cryptosporidium hominis]CUV04813.1 unnamed protein product [Cryptosporidium hominis]|eukprot:PPS93242.1 Uncharacterized protein GY17_00003779 [Cryptosporidium hominis]